MRLMMEIVGIAVAIASMFPPNALAYSVLPTKTNFLATKDVPLHYRNIKPSQSRLFMASPEGSDVSPIVDQLLELVGKKQESEENPKEDPIPDLMSKLSSNAQDYVLDEESPSSLFEPLVGYYNVSYTLTSRPNDNPVGGKWTRGLWTIKRTMQHVLPPLQTSDETTSEEFSSVASKAVAQVVNAIRLELLWGFVGVWVLLRGDAVPLKLDPASNEDASAESNSKKSPPKLLPNLSDRTVKAYFDRPLIGVSLRRRGKQKPFLKRVLTLGPTSAVVLDTPYADSRIRLGKGGTSGSQFVFSRLPETDEEARDGWKWLLEDGKHKVGKSLTKTGLVVRLGTLGLVFGIVSKLVQQRWVKVLASVYGVISGVSILGLLRSTGGIETEGDTYMEGNQ